MLRFLFLLFGLIGLHTDSSDSELLLPVQIIIPEKKRSTSRDGVETNVSYNIVIDGKTYTVNLMQKAFLPPSFRVYGYNGTGYMKPFEQHIQNFCYYQGNIEGYPNSMVILSTCTGLRGLLQFENVSYGIEPLEPSVGFEHVIYQVNNKNTGASLYTEEDIDPRDLPFKIQSVQSPTDFSSYIEMHVVVEKNLYTHMGSDTAIVTQKIFQLIGLTNAIFTSFNITIILSSLELWIDENKMPVTGDVNELLHKFLKWKRSYLVLRPHDMAFLLVYREKSDYVGATFQGKMCDRQFGGGIAVHPKTLSLESLAVIIAQLLSLSMGIAYDDIDKCQCSGAVCIMNPEAIHSSGVKIFSNCSMEDFAHFISKPKSQCLRNHPRLDPSYKVGVCGNKKVEDGETCDCGTADECNQIQDNCCDSTTCALKAGLACLMGSCCTKCQFSPKGTPCRSSIHECDLPEYCNGSSGECQEDFYVQDGHPCEQNKWLCVQGKCKSMESQCADAFGEALGEAPPECFKYLNSMTDRSGNCGADASGYKKCDPNDVMCGKLICKHEGENILESDSATIIYTNVNGNICVALDYKYDHADSDKMWVKDGTVCGTNKVGNHRCGEMKLCRKQKCIDNDLNYDCTPQKCHNQGVCNNKKNCHCNPKYLPPDCQKEEDSFPGGSVDSGNFLAVATTPGQARNLERHYVENVYPSKPTRWPFFLLIPFCVVLSIMIITLVKVYLQRKKWKTEDYTSDEELESESESKSSLENRDSIIS